MKSQFPLFQSHLDVAHNYWRGIVNQGDTVIDATCGNGHDTLVLCKLALTPNSGNVIAMDIQQKAIEQTRALLEKELEPNLNTRVELIHGSHVEFPPNSGIKLVVYNLGYLPKGDKNLTTKVESTLASVTNAKELISHGGAISITCYPGHEEGALEEKALLDFVSQWDPKEWSCCYKQWLNRRRSPSLLLIQRSLNH